MSTLNVRSKTGCLTCKNRRKKCDEKRPVCERCTRAKIECLGYAHLDNMLEKPQRRARRAALPVPPTYPDASEPPLGSLGALLDTLDSSVVPDNDSTRPSSSRLTSFQSPGDLPNSTLSSTSWCDVDEFWHTSDPCSLDTSGLLNGSLEFPDLNTVPLELYSSTQNLEYLAHSYPPSGSDLLGQDTSLPQRDSSHNLSFDSTKFTLDVGRDDESETSQDSDTENYQTAVYRTLSLDRGVPSNNMPFILQCYAKWITRCVFDPLRLANPAKDFLFSRVARSETARGVTILKANTCQLLLNDSTSSVDHLPVVPIFCDRIRNNVLAVKAKPIPSSEAEALEVMDVVANVMEVMYIYFLSQPLSSTLSFIQAAAIVYRRACSEPPGMPVNLRARLLHPDISIRYFPAIDIHFSVRTGRPMYLDYDTTDVPELYEYMSDVGLRFLEGMPDEFLFMLARINTLRYSGLSVDPTLVEELERQLQLFRPITDSMQDSFMNIAGVVIQEAWRQAIYIYTYMGLCGANSADERVTAALKKFVQILRRAGASQRQDEFLLLPMIIAGVAASRRSDRELLQSRMLGLRECARPHTCGFDSLLIMLEIWTIREAQRRPATWSDLSLAVTKVTGV